MLSGQILHRFTVFIIAIGLIVFYSHHAFAQSIDDIRYGIHGNETRIVLDMSAKSPYSHQVLSSPPRLVIDMAQSYSVPTRLKADATGQVNQVRQGILANGGRRIVFDMNKPFSVSQNFYLPPNASNSKYRLVFDIAPHGDNMQVIAPSDFNQAPISSAAPPSPPLLNEAFYPLPTPKPAFFNQPVQKYTIVIDAGHGGGDPGSLGHNKVQEKDIVLSIAKKLKNELERSGRYNVLLTRTSDYYIQLRERFQRARDMKADMFISLHADKIHVPSVRGVSVYTLSETASDKETARLARQENNAGVVAGVDLGVEEEDVANILLDLVRRETLNESKLFAELFVSNLKTHQVRYLKNPHRYAGFAVLKAPDVPSVLIETGFLSNRQDAELLQSASYQDKLARTIHSAMDQFFDRLERLNSE